MTATQNAPNGDDRRHGLWRGMAVVGVALLAAGAVAPAMAAAPLTKQKVTAIVKKQIPKTGGALFIEESELVRYGPINLGVGQNAPVASIGPFDLIARCDAIDDASDGPPLEERAQILIHTSEDNSAFESDDETFDDFDSGGFELWASEIANDPGQQDINTEDDDDAHAAAPSGTRISALANRITLNQGGVACSFSGSILMLP